jgi:hypothetical protein
MCRSGFPGCGRADDLVGCPELGASLENNQLRTRIAELETALRPFASNKYNYTPAGNGNTEQAHVYCSSDDLRRARAALDSKPRDDGETGK